VSWQIIIFYTVSEKGCQYYFFE